MCVHETVKMNTKKKLYDSLNRSLASIKVYPSSSQEIQPSVRSLQRSQLVQD